VKLLKELSWNEQGLIPAIAQDDKTGDVLMMAWMDESALLETIESKKAVYWSRSRQKLWRKGEQSGHQQLVKDIRIDCDRDVVLLKVEQLGGIACHTGRRSCFFKQLNIDEWVDVEPVLKDPTEIYKS